MFLEYKRGNRFSSFIRRKAVISIMKVLIVLVSMVAFASAQINMLCGCKPTYPLCASDHQTYQSECAMRCYPNNLSNIYKLYDGPCHSIGAHMSGQHPMAMHSFRRDGDQQQQQYLSQYYQQS